MRSGIEQPDPIESSGYKELQVLTEVEASSDITQRQLSQRAGIALGLTNAILRNLIKKGYIRSQQASWKRWVYALTPEGASFKVRLIIGYVHRFLDHYKRVRQSLREQLEPLALHEESRVAILGTGEFAELVYLGLREMGIEEIDIFVSQHNGSGKFLGMPIRDLGTLHHEEFDHVVVASLENQEAGHSELANMSVPAEKVVTLFSGAGSTEDVK